MKRDNYYPVTLGVLTGLGALALWYFSGLAIEKAIVPTSFQSIVTLATSAFGAFFGALCAFKYRQHEEKLNKRSKQMAALNTCLFNMARQHNAVSLILRGYKEFPSDLERAFSMPLIKPPKYDITLNTPDLLFIADHGHMQLLFNLTIEQERFEQTLMAVDNRNTYSNEKLAPAFAKSNLSGKPVTREILKEELGDVLFTSALQASETAFTFTKEAAESIFKTQLQLHKVAKEIFPGGAFFLASNGTDAEAQARP